jgi:hypothetical protein
MGEMSDTIESRADQLPQEIVYAVARALYKREKHRADVTDQVLCRAGGRPFKSTMEPWEEVEEMYLGDAKAALNAYFLAAFTEEGA